MRPPKSRRREAAESAYEERDAREEFRLAREARDNWRAEADRVAKDNDALRAEVERLTQFAAERNDECVGYTERIATLEAEVERLCQGLWDCAYILGVDQDGDKTPAALVHPDIVQYAKLACQESVRDYDAALGEHDEYEARIATLEAEVERLQNERDRYAVRRDALNRIVTLEAQIDALEALLRRWLNAQFGSMAEVYSSMMAEVYRDTNAYLQDGGIATDSREKPAYREYPSGDHDSRPVG